MFIQIFETNLYDTHTCGLKSVQLVIIAEESVIKLELVSNAK